jgi:hypothetical protein
VGGFMHLSVPLGIEHDLSDTRAIAKVDKHHHAMVATALHPALQDDGLTDMRSLQFTTSMRSDFHVTLSFLIGR